MTHAAAELLAEPALPIVCGSLQCMEPMSRRCMSSRAYSPPSLSCGGPEEDKSEKLQRVIIITLDLR